MSANVTSATPATDDVDVVPPSIFSDVIIPIVYSFTFFVGLVGNMLVIYILKTPYSSISISNFLLINLAVADLFLISTLPLWATTYAFQSKWIFGEDLCRLSSFCSFFSMYATTFFIVFMAMDRFAVLILQPKKRKFRTKRIICAAVIVLWIFSLALSIPAAIYRTTVFKGRIEETEYCIWSFNDTMTSDHIWYYVHNIGIKFCFGFGIPMIIIVYCYAPIIVYLKKQSGFQNNVCKRKMQATKTITLVILVFGICWLPNKISATVIILQSLELIKLSNQSQQIHNTIHLATNVLIWAHACVNPFLYAFTKDEVKKKLLVMYLTFKARFCGKSAQTIKNTDVQLKLIKEGDKRCFEEGTLNIKPHSNELARAQTTKRFSQNQSKSTMVSLFVSSENSIKKKKFCKKNSDKKKLSQL